MMSALEEVGAVTVYTLFALGLVTMVALAWIGGGLVSIHLADMWSGVRKLKQEHRSKRALEETCGTL